MDLDSIKNDKAMMKVRTLWKEPLFYFFLLGTVIFGIHAFLKANSSKESDRYEVQITSSDVDWLRNRWNKLMSRDPTPDELQGLIDSMIREEILYDQQLTDYFKENQDRYRIPANITFTHIFFSSDKRSQTAQADAAAAFEKIQQRNINHENALSLGDPFMKGLAFGDQSTDQVARIFGNYFSEKLEVLETGKWQGPVRSSYGWHLVYIDKLIPTSVPELEQVRSKVQIDYVSQNRDKVNRQVYEDISARYSVLVEDLPYDLEIK
jgi:hypothetical protein